MKKLIGGLLVISLLSRPSLLKIDYIAYELYKASDQIIRGILATQSEEEEAEEEIGQMDIDTAFDGIDRNAKGISRLLKDLNNEMGKMSAIMQLKSITKENMSDAQIQAFSEFSSYYNGETENLNETLTQLSGDLGDRSLRSEIMSADTDFKQLYDQLKNISDYQFTAISNINDMIRAAQETLEFIA